MRRRNYKFCNYWCNGLLLWETIAHSNGQGFVTIILLRRNHFVRWSGACYEIHRHIVVYWWWVFKKAQILGLSRDHMSSMEINMKWISWIGSIELFSRFEKKACEFAQKCCNDSIKSQNIYFQARWHDKNFWKTIRKIEKDSLFLKAVSLLISNPQYRIRRMDTLSNFLQSVSSHIHF